MKARTLIVGAALWVGVVAVGSGVTWLVIEQVGRNVVSGQDPSGTSPAAETPVPSSSAGTPRPKPSAASTAGSTPSASSTDTPGSASPTDASGPEPGAPVTTPPRTTDPESPRRPTRTWSGSGGRLTVSCTGARAGLVSASPSDGWRVEIESRGPEQVKVEFKQGGEGAETHVRSRCNGGEPHFAIEADD